MNSTNPSQRETSKRGKWRKFLQPRRHRHDPMLVLNLSLFNFEGGWNRTFNPTRERENVWP
jgi:hypothetical protein